MSPIVNFENILSVIPQRPPFVMIDTLLEAGDANASSAFTILPDNVLVINGYLREPGLIENIAQTAAARFGYLCLANNQTVPNGFIGALSRLQINRLPAVHTRIETRIVITNQVFNATLVKGEVLDGDQVIATCEMKIFS